MTALGIHIGRRMMRDVTLPVCVRADEDVVWGCVRHSDSSLRVCPVQTIYLSPEPPENLALMRLRRQASILFPALAVVCLLCAIFLYFLNSFHNNKSDNKLSFLVPCLIKDVSAVGVTCNVQGHAQLIRPQELFPDGLSRLIGINGTQKQFSYTQSGRTYNISFIQPNPSTP